MLDGLRDLIRGQRVVPTAPQSFAPSIPDADDWEDAEEGDYDPDLASIAGVGCIITYSSSGGSISVRRVTCRKLSRKGTVLYLQGFCHERGALRTFRLDRMTEVACGVTGEVHVPGSAFFEGYETMADGGAAVGFGLHVRLAADFRAGLNVLAFLAKVDGKFVPAEQEVMRAYCSSFGLRYCTDDFDHDGACTYAVRLAPDAETFYVAMERLTRAGAPAGLASLIRSFAGRLIDADGIQHPKEFYYGVRLQEYLAEA